MSTESEAKEIGVDRIIDPRENAAAREELRSIYDLLDPGDWIRVLAFFDRSDDQDSSVGQFSEIEGHIERFDSEACWFTVDRRVDWAADQSRTTTRPSPGFHGRTAGVTLLVGDTLPQDRQDELDEFEEKYHLNREKSDYDVRGEDDTPEALAFPLGYLCRVTGMAGSIHGTQIATADLTREG